MIYKVRLLVQEVTPYIFEIEADSDKEAIDYVRYKAFLDEGKAEMSICNDIDCCVIEEIDDEGL